MFITAVCSTFQFQHFLGSTPPISNYCRSMDMHTRNVPLGPSSSLRTLLKVSHQVLIHGKSVEESQGNSSEVLYPSGSGNLKKEDVRYENIFLWDLCSFTQSQEIVLRWAKKHFQSKHKFFQARNLLTNEIFVNMVNLVPVLTSHLGASYPIWHAVVANCCPDNGQACSLEKKTSSTTSF